MNIDDMKLAEVGPITMKRENGVWKVQSASASGEGKSFTEALENLLLTLRSRVVCGVQ